MRFFTMLAFLCTIIMGNTVWANTISGDIKGRVIDANSNEPLDFVNVTLRKKGTENAIPLGAITDMDGNFTIPNVPEATYQLQVSFIGYQTYEQDITLTGQSRTVTLPPIFFIGRFPNVERSSGCRDAVTNAF